MVKFDIVLRFFEAYQPEPETITWNMQAHSLGFYEIY